MNDATAVTAGVAATATLAAWVAGDDPASTSDRARTWAKHTLLDWLAVTIAGSREPLVDMLAEEYPARADGACALVGRGGAVGPIEAALINGSAGHALDFDDVSSRTVGHPTAPIAPAALALGQLTGASGEQLLRALVVGFEAQAFLGESLGAAHYQLGFHTTGTIGTFGAAAAAASLLRLDAARTRTAFGLAATEAAGLKCNFGTMAKPLHAGRAAANGLLAARLAARGFTAHESALECAQGFAHTQVPGAVAWRDRIDTSRGFAIESALFKYHASCYLTHPTIEAVRTLREQHGLALDALDAMTIHVAGNHRGVCDIDEPRTGLNVKFSIRHLAALALDGADTADLALYDEATAQDPRLAQARRRVSLQVGAPGSVGPHAARVVLRTRDGRTLEAMADVGEPWSDLDAQWSRLVAKGRAIAAPVIGADRYERLVTAIHTLERAPSLNPLIEAIR